MRRRLFTTLSALSLLLFVASILLWVRSHRTRHIVARGVCGRHVQVTSARGGLWFSVYDSGFRPAHWLHDRHHIRSPEEDFGHALDGMNRVVRELGYAQDVLHGMRATGGAAAYGPTAMVKAEMDLLREAHRHARVSARWQAEFAARHLASRRASRLGFAWHPGHVERHPWDDGFHLAPVVVLPYWALSFLTAAMPAAFTVRRLKRRALPRRGLCPSCGYDLRATPGRCPECGLVPTAPPPPQGGK